MRESLSRLPGASRRRFQTRRTESDAGPRLPWAASASRDVAEQGKAGEDGQNRRYFLASSSAAGLRCGCGGTKRCPVTTARTPGFACGTPAGNRGGKRQVPGGRGCLRRQSLVSGFSPSSRGGTIHGFPVTSAGAEGLPGRPVTPPVAGLPPPGAGTGCCFSPALPRSGSGRTELSVRPALARARTAQKRLRWEQRPRSAHRLLEPRWWLCEARPGTGREGRPGAADPSGAVVDPGGAV
ncbi:uncharacterized protein LOC134168188 [Pezoporus occidentalis]|uniref:uncharacterized protein LOC134168188 n=1 Tax=Pezoporus occidentalis TaxID=407982 RepID=UPI002F9136B5